MIDEFGVDNIDDAGRLFNSVYTKIMFKDYLEDNNMKVCELQVIINDVYLSFVNNTDKKSIYHVSIYILSFG